MTEHVFTFLGNGTWVASDRGPYGANFAFKQAANPSRLTATDFTELGSGPKDFSVEMWFKNLGMGAFEQLGLFSNFGGAQDIGISVHQNNPPGFPSDLFFHVGCPGEFDDEYITAFTVGTWYHLVFTWRESTKTKNFYINGSVVKTVVNGSGRTQDLASAELELGHNANGEGVTDEIRVYQKTLTPAEVADHHNDIFANAFCLVLYLPFTEGSGTTATTDTAGEGDTACGARILADEGPYNLVGEDLNFRFFHAPLGDSGTYSIDGSNLEVAPFRIYLDYEP